MVSIGILEKKSDCLGYLQKYLSKKKKKSEVKKKKKKGMYMGIGGTNGPSRGIGGTG